MVVPSHQDRSHFGVGLAPLGAACTLPDLCPCFEWALAKHVLEEAGQVVFIRFTHQQRGCAHKPAQACSFNKAGLPQEGPPTPTRMEASQSVSVGSCSVSQIYFGQLGEGTDLQKPSREQFGVSKSHSVSLVPLPIGGLVFMWWGGRRRWHLPPSLFLGESPQDSLFLWDE